MSFQMSEELRMAVDGLRKLLDKEIEPSYLAHGEGPIPKEKMKGWTKQLAEYGLINAPSPRSSVAWGWIGRLTCVCGKRSR